MHGAVGRAALLVTFPIAAAVFGSLLAAVRPPGERVTSGIQHFAAGVVFAAVAGEVLPDLRGESLAAVVIGFSIGVVLLLGIGALADEDGTFQMGSQAAGARSRMPLGMLAAVGIDLLLDGVLVGIGAVQGAAQGRVLTIALTLEILFLALAVSAALRERGTSDAASVGIPIGLSLTVAVGAVVSAVILGGASPAVLAGVLAFGAAALLYLVVEELLVEAHEKPDAPLLTGLFFVGFLALFVLEGVI